MKRAAQKRTNPQSAKKKKASHKAADEFGGANNTNFFLEGDSDDEQRQEESEHEVEETAEEKRLRLARAYIDDLKGRRDEDDSAEGTDMSEDEGYQVDREDRGRSDALGAMLKENALHEGGYLHRNVADRVHMQEIAECSASQSPVLAMRAHRLAVTAVALTDDDSRAYTVSKCGTMFAWDLETGKKVKVGTHEAVLTQAIPEEGTTADWVRKTGPQVSKRALLAVAVSSDGRLIATGGGDKKVRIYDARTLQEVNAFPGHRDVVSGLAFREGTHELYSASFDRTVKIWSVDDRAYMDTLFGHQAEVLCVDARRAERPVSGGYDHTCRLWKIPDESQLVFRAHGMAVECCSMISSSQWVTGDQDGAVALWANTKKKPVFIARNASSPHTQQVGAGSCGEACTKWIGSVSLCKGTDLLASGAGDGVVRFWKLEGGKEGMTGLTLKGGVPVRGFVNGVAVARSARFALAATGQEPRLGRWARDTKARNGLALLRLDVD